MLVLEFFGLYFLCIYCWGFEGNGFGWDSVCVLSFLCYFLIDWLSWLILSCLNVKKFVLDYVYGF